MYVKTNFFSHFKYNIFLQNKLVTIQQQDYKIFSAKMTQ